MSINKTPEKEERQGEAYSSTAAELEKTFAEQAEHNLILKKELSEKEYLISKLKEEYNRYKGENEAIRNSISWLITSPLRKAGYIYRNFVGIIYIFIELIQVVGGFQNIVKKCIKAYRRGGIQEIIQGIHLAFSSLPPNPVSDYLCKSRNNYSRWITQYDTLSNDTRTKLQHRQDAFTLKPLISVIMPVFNPKQKWLKEAVESVRKQIYTNWELCIADDASTDSAIKKILEDFSMEDERIKVIYRSENGHISAASNSALSLASGIWVSFLDQDDLYSEHALYWVVDAINKYPEAGLIYSDEDKVSEGGRRLHPYFKCDWNPDLFYSQNLISHLGVYKAVIVKEVGGFRTGFEGSQDYDLALRCIEKLKPNQIIHIPRILYHWRYHRMSTSMNTDSKTYAVVAGEKALNEHFLRTGIDAKTHYNGNGYTSIYSLPEKLPLVSIIIPIRNKKNILENCLSSIFERTGYSNYEILIIDNGSDESDTLEFLQEISLNEKITIFRDDRPFNYSRLNNKAVSLARGEIIALLNNDVEIMSPDWLTVMVSHALRPGIGAIGAKLWYPNQTLQHGGVILGIMGIANHAGLHSKKGNAGYFSRLLLTQNLSAVTGACLVVKKSIFIEVGGLDEVNLPIAFNDVDFCLRVSRAGYRNVWTPSAELIHHESASRGHEDTPQKQERFTREVSFMKETWGELLDKDPAYSPNLTLDHYDFSLAWPPRIELL